MAPQTAASVRGCLLLLLHRPVFRWNLLLHVHVHCEVVALLRARRCRLRCKDAVDTCNKERQQELLSSIAPTRPTRLRGKSDFRRGAEIRFDTFDKMLRAVA